MNVNLLKQQFDDLARDFAKLRLADEGSILGTIESMQGEIDALAKHIIDTVAGLQTHIGALTDQCTALQTSYKQAMSAVPRLRLDLETTKSETQAALFELRSIILELAVKLQVSVERKGLWKRLRSWLRG